MSNFVAEIRPRSRDIPKFIPTQTTGDFVAEIRPRQNYGSQARHIDRHSHPTDYIDQDLESILSETEFSTDRVTRLLEGSILTLVETVLAGRPITRIEGCLYISLDSLESPLMVKLSRTSPNFKNGKDCCFSKQSLENQLNVKVKNSDLSSPRSDLTTGSENLTTPLHSPVLPTSKNDKCFAVDDFFRVSDRDAFYDIPDSNHISCFPLECSRDGERCSPFSPGNDAHHQPLSPDKEVAPAAGSFPVDKSAILDHRARCESEDESGYTSNEKEDKDWSRPPAGYRQGRTFNDYYCSGFDGKSTVYSSDEKDPAVVVPGERTPYCQMSSNEASDEMDGDSDDDENEENNADEDDMDIESPLVIDERPVMNLSDLNTEPFSSMDGKIDKAQIRKIPQQLSSDLICVEENRILQPERHNEDMDWPQGSDMTDTDVPVDLSCDSSPSLDVQVTNPHAQSLVVKHPDGFRCKRCSQILPDTEAVSRHALSHHDLYCCTFCCRPFTAKNNLKRHTRMHTGQRPYQCSQCAASFARRDDLKGHMLRHDYSKPFRCSLCHKGYTDRACVKNHMAKEHRSRLMHVCPQCGESYDQEEAFSAHKKTHPELQQFSCATCSFIGTNNLMTLKHSLLHSYKLFSCRPCNAYFADPFDYTNHVRKHKKMVSFCHYVCCFCDVALSTYEQYVRHEYSHAQSKTHTCRICKKQFKSKQHLQEHATSHHKQQRQQQQQQLNEVDSQESCKMNVDFQEMCGASTQTKETMDTEVHNVNNDYSNCSRDSTTFPVCLATTEEDNEDDNREQETEEEEEAQLLDLRINKTSESTVVSSGTNEKYGDFRSYPRVPGLAEGNFPRNGVVLSESCSLARGREVEEGNQTPQPVCNKRDSTGVCISRKNYIYDTRRYSHNLQVPEYPMDCGKEDQTKYLLQVTPPTPVRARSEDKLQAVAHSPYMNFELRPLKRTVSQDVRRRTPLRFNPYYREKMADLAAKFIAARGTQLFEQRPPLQAVLANCQNKHPGLSSGVADDHRPRTPFSISSKHQTTPPVHQATPPGHQATPPRHQTTSSRHQNTPPIRQGTSPIHQATPPRNQATPPRYQSLILADRVSKQDTVFVSDLPSNQKTSLSPGGQADRDNIPREDSNPETALLYHAPVVVKSENLFQTEVPSQVFEKQRLQNTPRPNTSPVNDFLNSIPHSQISSHSCEDCREEFGSFLELENHSVEMHKRYLCEHCGKSFTARPNRDRHVRYHTGERPYSCDLCQQAFFRGDDLKYHRTTRHPTAKPYTCNFCSASFTWGRDLDRHIRHSKCKA